MWQTLGQLCFFHVFFLLVRTVPALKFRNPTGISFSGKENLLAECRRWEYFTESKEYLKSQTEGVRGNLLHATQPLEPGIWVLRTFLYLLLLLLSVCLSYFSLHCSFFMVKNTACLIFGFPNSTFHPHERDGPNLILSFPTLTFLEKKSAW